MCDILMESICRLCLKDNFTLVSIYSSRTPFGEAVFRVLNEIYDLKISKEDRLPSKICVPCLWRMYEFDTYKKNVKYADSELGKLLSRTSSNTDEVSNEEGNANVVFGEEEIPMNDAIDLGDARVSVKEMEVSMKQEIEIVEWTMPEQIQLKKDILEMSIGKDNLHKNAESDVLEEELDEMEVPVKDEIEIVEWEMPNELRLKAVIEKEHCSERHFSLEEGINSIDNAVDASELIFECHEINTSVCVRDAQESAEMVENVSSVDSNSENKDENEEVMQEDVLNVGIDGKESFDALILESSDDLSELASSRSVTPVNSKKAFICDICKKSFVSKYHLGVHIRVHYHDRPFKCNTCGKAFKQDNERKRHQLLHLRMENGKNEDGNASKPYSCNICPKKFKSRLSLCSHSYVHKNKYICRFCGKSFQNNSHLNEHLRIHTNNKPFSCKVCKMSFSCKGNVKDHMAIHSEDRPFQCNVCHKRFKSRKHTSRHELIHLRRK